MLGPAHGSQAPDPPLRSDAQLIADGVARPSRRGKQARAGRTALQLPARASATAIHEYPQHPRYRATRDCTQEAAGFSSWA